MTKNTTPLNNFIDIRKIGLLILLSIFFTNAYFILFNQQYYIDILGYYFAHDGQVRDPDITPYKTQSLIFFIIIIYSYFLWLFPNKQVKTHQATEIQWKYNILFYIIISILWFLISFIPPVLFDFNTIRLLSSEDSFYENAGFCWLFLTSISFFYLFFRKEYESNIPALKKKHNVFFLLLGLLFFFGAGEEISWGQRLLKFQTPTTLKDNIQHEFNIHNLPFFDPRTTTLKNPKVKNVFQRKKGIASFFTIVNLFSMFWFVFCVVLPILHLSSHKIRKLLDHIYLPVVPLWIGSLFILNFLIYHKLLPHLITYRMAYPMDEIRESGYSFLFAVLALWFINSSSKKNHKTSNSNPTIG